MAKSTGKMKIYTRTGDDGSTGLSTGRRVSKDHLRMEVCGTLDELNASLGVARAAEPHMAVIAYIEEIQTLLFHAGADFADASESQLPQNARISAKQTEWLEINIDKITNDLAPLSHFILPGGVLSAAYIHLARTVCRRAERLAVSLNKVQPVNNELLSFLNRLSDFLFVLARYENHLSMEAESKWIPRSIL